jgi:hypothetical protein
MIDSAVNCDWLSRVGRLLLSVVSVEAALASRDV